jgi:hypothetical protein
MTYEIRPSEYDDGLYQIFKGDQLAWGAYLFERDRAVQVAANYTELDRLDKAVEDVIGQTRHYNIVVTSGPGYRPDGPPLWYITDPSQGLENYGFAHYLHTPPPVDVYTRGQYEQACSATGITTAPDSELGNYADKYGEFSPSNDPRTYMEFALRRRRMAGMKREHADDVKRRRGRLAEAGLTEGHLDRSQYERACTIMGVPVLTDRMAGHLASQGMGEVTVVIPGEPGDEVSRELAGAPRGRY